MLFHFDPEGLYTGEIDGMVLEGIRIVKYARDDFNLKVKLNGVWSGEKVFLYYRQKPPRVQADYKTFALLDLLVANKEKGHFKIIDKLTVVLNEKNDQYETTFANLGITKVPISSTLIKKHKKVLSGGGVWCIVSMGFCGKHQKTCSLYA